ncbi:hypothetical protein [Pseudomonas putida]|uniref:hypothetical protein n=1 Tax=Pseudomonas putida TaxID=303 RepID=UPI002363B84F|nr:hypothetical protein [Pseudomonas putida]MDD2005093.1 hypothetical protein [Pseudomonas putida]
MNITSHLENIKSLLEGLPSKPVIKLFSGTFADTDLKNLQLDGQRPYILLACAGGPIPEKSKRVKLEVDAVFGAFVVGKTDPDTRGVSRVASDTAVDIASVLEKYRGEQTANSKLPELQSIEELFSGEKSGTNFSAWSVLWTQRIVLG